MIEYVPTTDQFVCVLNKKIGTPKLLNAVGHMSAGLMSKFRDDMSAMRFRDFIDKDKTAHPAISENGYIVLRADNSNQLRTLRNLLIKDGIAFTDFTDTMTGGTYVDQQEKFCVTSEQDLEYYGICFFMNKERSRELTKKFSLFVG